MRLIALAKIRNAGREVPVGGEFEIDDKQGRALIVTRRAKATVPQPEPPVVPEEVQTGEPPPRRRYRRRDMEAEAD